MKIDTTIFFLKYLLNILMNIVNSVYFFLEKFTLCFLCAVQAKGKTCELHLFIYPSIPNYCSRIQRIHNSQLKLVRHLENEVPCADMATYKVCLKTVEPQNATTTTPRTYSFRYNNAYT